MRREQVRKNVQAFRRRKQQHAEPADRCTGKSGSYTFVQEKVNRANDRGWTEKALKDQRELGLEDVQQPSEALSLPYRPRNVPSQSQSSRIGHSDYATSLSVTLPLEINAANLSLQQLVAAATISFAPRQPSGTIGRHWTETLSVIANNNSTLDLSLQALCLLQIGNVQSQTWLLHQSISLYDRALKDLRATLTDPRNGPDGLYGFRVEIFATAMALAFYELLSQNARSERGIGWMAHIEGAVTYLSMFPGLDVFALCHQLSFHFLETICIFDALGARKPNCFSNSKWWRNNVDRLSDQAYGALLRMITTLPSVLEKIDKTPEMVGGEEEAGWMGLLAVCQKLEAAFLDWFECNMNQNAARQTWTGAGKGTCMLLEPDHLDPDPNVEFPSLYVARIYLLYWTCMILLYESLITIHQNLGLNAAVDPLSTSIPGADPTLHYSTTAQAFALKVRYSVDYCLRPGYGIIGKSIIMLPLWIARKNLRSCGDEEAKWCDGEIERLGMRGISFGLKVKKEC